MSDGVKFIFKTLIKIPIIIIVSYLIFNLFSYTVAYFRLYSAAQMVSSIVMENGYLPGNVGDDSTLLGQVDKYVEKNITTNLMIPFEGETCTGVTVKTTGKGVTGNVTDENNTRVQYGGEAKILVKGHLVWLLPLVNIKGEYLQGDGVRGIDGTGNTMYETDVEGELEKRGFSEHNDVTSGLWLKTDISFEYTVPCLKYYSDIAE